MTIRGKFTATFDDMTLRHVTCLHAILAFLMAVQLAAHAAAAQTFADGATDPTVLKQIIIFGRHGVRSAAARNSVLERLASRPYPDFGVQTGFLTPHGAQAEILLGSYFRRYLLAEGLLTGCDHVDVRRSYFRSNSIQRSNITASSLARDLMPNAAVPIHSYPLGQADPVFDPIAAKIVTLDTERAVQELSGAFNGAALTPAFSGAFSLARSVLFNYARGTRPDPPAPDGLVDPLGMPIPLTATTDNVQTGNVINVGGLNVISSATDPFVMEYANNMPLRDVAWGQLSLNELSQLTRFITLAFSIEMTPPYLNAAQSSNAAAHILRSMEQALSGRHVAGAFGMPRTNLLVIISSDAYVVGLAGLLHMHWLLPGYQPDFAAPGGALVFELREVRSTGDFIVRVYYTAQTLDQLRNLTPLTIAEPPATMQLLIPNGGQAEASLDVTFRKFRELLTKAIDPCSVQDRAAEVPPGPLTGVPLR